MFPYFKGQPTDFILRYTGGTLCSSGLVRMPQCGIIFSDGMESDFIKFESGMRAKITVASRKVHLFWK